MPTISQTYPVKGMHCASCASVIETKLKKNPHVKTVSVSLATETVSLELDSNTKTSDLNNLIEPLGYTLIDDTDSNPSDNLESEYVSDAYLTFPIAIFLFFVMIYDLISSYLIWMPPLPIPMAIFNYLIFAIATVVLSTTGVRYLKAIFTFISTGHANMDTLIGIGTLMAYLYSSFVLLFPILSTSLGFPDHLYYDVTIVVIGFVALGKALESISKAKTQDAIKALFKLQAKTAIVLRNGIEVEIPVDQVIIDDILIVKANSTIPVDGLIIEGSSATDESMITGESMPIDKKTGDNVIGGTLNTYSSIKVKVLKIGKDTVLAKIINLVSKAQNSKAPIEKLTDKISAIFVPIVLILSVVALISWIIFGFNLVGSSQSLSLGISAFVGMLVIACPCALGLATPTGIIVGVGNGAKNGILIKDAENIERLNQVDVIVFDKTGTLTQGKPTISQIEYLDKTAKESKLLNIITSIENESAHPLAKALVSELQGKYKSSFELVKDFKEHPGLGIQARVNGKFYYVGSYRFIDQLNLSYKHQNQAIPGTKIYIATSDKVLAIITMSDSLKSNSIKMVGELKQLGIKTIMATGDNATTANYISSQVKIDQVVSEALPNDKYQLIEKLKADGLKVAMVGDGVNDAPALTIADVGIAMSNGTDAAIETAGITIIHGDMSKVVYAVKLSKKVMRIIKQNLFWSFIYNLLGIPIAAGILYPMFGITLNPAIAGATMAFSSVSVVTNSLRLKNKIN